MEPSLPLLALLKVFLPLRPQCARVLLGALAILLVVLMVLMQQLMQSLVLMVLMQQLTLPMAAK